MAMAFPAGKDGAVVLPLNTASDFVAFDVDESQAVESVAAYGAAVYDPYRGSGTPHQMVNVAGFAKYGAAGTVPGFGHASVMASAGGGASTFTVGTGVTLAGSYVFANLRLAHSRIRAAVPLTYTMHNSGEITTTWPVA